MKKKLEEAIKSDNVAEVRNILLQMVTSKGGSVSMIRDMAEAIGSTKNLFDKDDGKIYANSAKELTRNQIEALREDVKRNFSISKFKLLAEVQEIERTHPSYFRDGTQDVREDFLYPDGSAMVLEEHIVNDDVVTLEAHEVLPEPGDNSEDTSEERYEVKFDSDPEETSEEILEVEDEKASKAVSAGKVIGYVLIVLGVAAAITAICIALKFLLGIGIGIIMLGAAIAYFFINR